MNLTRLTAAAALVIATCLGSFALAQQPKRDRKPRPKPAATVDAAPEAKPEEEKVAGEAKADAGAQPAPVLVPTETADGGVRASPLNPAPGEMPGSSNVDAGTVDYDRLLADLAALRTRVAAVGEGLFQSKMAVALRVDGDRARLAKITVSVDDGVVYTSPQGFRGDDLTPVFARALAPGRHALTVDVEREDKENAAFKSGQKSRFIVEIPRDEQLDVEVRVEDDSTMGDLPAKKSGRYDLRVRVKATARPLKR